MRPPGVRVVPRVDHGPTVEIDDGDAAGQAIELLGG
jgi:hypothetical protein